MTEPHNPRRPRPIVSCLRCRYKKLKCNRKAPCENCVKAFTDKTCTYSRDGGHIPSVDGLSSSVASTASSIEDLQRRMVVVEQLLGARQAAYEQLSESDAAVSPNVLETVTVKGGRGVYHGQNDRVTLLNQVRLVHSQNWDGTPIVCPGIAKQTLRSSLLILCSSQRSSNSWTSCPTMSTSRLRRSKSSFSRPSQCPWCHRRRLSKTLSSFQLR